MYMYKEFKMLCKTLVFIVQTATASYVTALPPPSLLKITSKVRHMYSLFLYYVCCSLRIHTTP